MWPLAMKNTCILRPFRLHRTSRGNRGEVHLILPRKDSSYKMFESDLVFRSCWEVGLSQCTCRAASWIIVPQIRVNQQLSWSVDSSVTDLSARGWSYHPIAFYTAKPALDEIAQSFSSGLGFLRWTLSVEVQYYKKPTPPIYDGSQSLTKPPCHTA